MTKHTFKVGDKVTVKNHPEYGVSTLDVPFKKGFYLTSEFGDFFWINSKNIESYTETRGRKRKVNKVIKKIANDAAKKADQFLKERNGYSDPIQQILNAEPGTILKDGRGLEAKVLDQGLFVRFVDHKGEINVGDQWIGKDDLINLEFKVSTPKTYSFQGETMTADQIRQVLEKDK